MAGANRLLVAALSVGLSVGLACAPAQARSRIDIVGSSTVSPFIEIVIEAYRGRSDVNFISTSTGTGGGFRSFCAGVGEAFPDIAGASRPIKAAEFDECAEHGVGQIIEIKIGHDGIVIASAAKVAPVGFELGSLYRALAAKLPSQNGATDNPYTKWSQVDSRLPDRFIVMYGPPETSGTRDAFEALVMSAACRREPGYEALADADRNAVCGELRAPPHYIEMTENDLDTVRILQTDKNGFGIFGYFFSYSNPMILTTHEVEGVSPSFETIASGAYPLARPLFIYVKAQHFALVPELVEFVDFFLGDEMIGADGTLAEFGLVPMTAEEIAEARGRLAQRTPVARPAK